MPARATAQDGTYPRPQLVREHWTDLGGAWQFAHDDAGAGLRERWQGGTDLADRSRFDREITVPFPPESPASGIGDTGPHPVLWYRRTLPLGGVAGLDDVRSRGHRVVLRFGAVDRLARVWLDGALVGAHEGGQTPFAVDVTDALDDAALAGEREPVLVVRAEDDPRDSVQPRGKQDWRDVPHDIWYHRTSGIWQPVWLEVTPPVAVERLTWAPDVAAGVVRLAVELSADPVAPVTLAVRLEATLLEGSGVRHGGPGGAPAGAELLAEHTQLLTGRRSTAVVTIPALAHTMDRERLLWSPGQPQLVDAAVQLRSAEGAVLDEAASYCGLRDVDVLAGVLLLTGQPTYLRSVLAQNYWPASHLAAPDAAALRREVELVRAMGFNAVRIHQKVEDPRFLHWCDRLGVMTWGETAAAYVFSPEAVRQLTTEWVDVVARDAGHPCVVAWVPVNESWGVVDLERDPAQVQYAQALASLTRALDGSRPVVSNDGWHHVDSDLFTIHDYADTGAVLAARYGTRAAVEALLEPMGPNGRRLLVGPAAGSNPVAEGVPVMLTEFGGVRYAPGAADADGATWGYSTATSAEDFERRLADLLGAVHASTVLAGFCYTQLTDTMQEANGLLDEQRRPKLPLDVLHRIISGTPGDGAAGA